MVQHGYGVPVAGEAWPRRAVPEGQCRHRVMTFRMGRHNGPDPRRIK